MSQQIGFAAENQAKTYLTTQGLHWMMSNYRCRWGEVDLIMKDREHIVFVEVRSRVSAEYGGALESITPSKVRKIIKTATHYMVVKKIFDRYTARFDVVCIQGASADIQWIKNAFDASGY